VALRFSVMLPQTNSVASRDAILRVAETAEELDFDAVTVHDHLVFNGFWIASGMQDAENRSFFPSSPVHYAPRQTAASSGSCGAMPVVTAVSVGATPVL